MSVFFGARFWAWVFLFFLLTSEASARVSPVVHCLLETLSSIPSPIQKTLIQARQGARNLDHLELSVQLKTEKITLKHIRLVKDFPFEVLRSEVKNEDINLRRYYPLLIPKKGTTADSFKEIDLYRILNKNRFYDLPVYDHSNNEWFAEYHPLLSQERTITLIKSDPSDPKKVRVQESDFDIYHSLNFQYHTVEITLPYRKKHRIEIKIPVLPDGSTRMTLSELLRGISLLPIDSIEALQKLEVSPSFVKSLKVEPGAFAEKGRTVITRHIGPRFIGSLRHEQGHQIALFLWKKFEPTKAWIKAMQKDADFISNYAKTEIAEDFAETVKAYLNTDGGLISPYLRNKFGARFAYLDTIFQEEFNQSPEGDFWKNIQTYHRLTFQNYNVFSLEPQGSSLTYYAFGLSGGSLFYHFYLKPLLNEENQ